MTPPHPLPRYRRMSGRDRFVSYGSAMLSAFVTGLLLELLRLTIRQLRQGRRP